MLPSYENLVEAAYKIEAIDAGISEAVHSTQWAWYTLGITRPLIVHTTATTQGPLNTWTEHSNCQIHSRGNSKTLIVLLTSNIFLIFL